MLRSTFANISIGLAGFAILGLSASAALGQTAMQVRVNVAPVATDVVWTKAVGKALEKQVSCQFSASTPGATTWPVPRGYMRGGASGKTILFNPGFASWDGTKEVFAPKTNDDGFNTLFVSGTQAADAKTMICKGAILLDGQEVSVPAGNTVVGSLSDIAAKGPLTLSLTLDPIKFKNALVPSGQILASAYESGVSLPNTFDFDTQTFGAPGADVKLEVVPGVNGASFQKGVKITPLNGATSGKISWFLADNMTQAASEIKFSTASYVTSADYHVEAIFVKTNEGRLVKINFYFSGQKGMPTPPAGFGWDYWVLQK